MIEIENLSKAFTLHNQGGATIRVMQGATLSVARGDCVALTGASGAGKSTLMRMIYGNYLAEAGRIRVGDTVVTDAAPRDILRMRRDTLGYVSQFLRRGAACPHARCGRRAASGRRHTRWTMPAPVPPPC